MKYILLFIVLSLFACTPKSLPTVISITDEKVEVKLSYMSTKSDLEEIVTQLKDKEQINLDYSKSTFFENGKLRDVALIVTLPSGKIGKASAMLAHIENQYFGFFLDKSTDGEERFKIGILSSN